MFAARFHCGLRRHEAEKRLGVLRGIVRGAELAIPLTKPSVFPRNGLLAARVASVWSGAAWLPAFVRQVYAANFVQDLDISQPDVLLGCLQSLAPDPSVILTTASHDDAKAQLRNNTEHAFDLGIFGSPTFVVGSELFWGNDRLEAAIRWATGKVRLN